MLCKLPLIPWGNMGYLLTHNFFSLLPSEQRGVLGCFHSPCVLCVLELALCLFAPYERTRTYVGRAAGSITYSLFL